MIHWDEYDYDLNEDERWDGGPCTRECRHCGKAGLHWEEMGPGVWRLCDEDGRMHRCDQKRLDRHAAADFEDLDK